MGAARRCRCLAAAQPASATAPATAPAPSAVPASAAVPTPVAALAPDAAAQWEALLREVRTCTRCPLHATRTQGVFGVGPKRADWLVIGEAPGAEEDRHGEPFVGAPDNCSMPCCAPSGSIARATSTSPTC